MGCTSSSGSNGAGSTAPAVVSTAAGTVTVRSGGKVVCVMTIKAGRGTCQVSSLQFKPGSVGFTSSYSATGSSKVTSTGKTSLTLNQATTTTKLTLSTSKVTLGSEQSAKVTVQVVPQYSGSPTGSVTVRTPGAVVCVIKLSAGGGSCQLSAKELPAGSHPLSATYPGDTNFRASASTQQTLNVSK